MELTVQLPDDLASRMSASGGDLSRGRSGENRDMTPNTGNQEVKLVHGIRGGIPNDRMEHIHARWPRSLELRNLNPCLENPLVALGSELTKVHAHVRLSQGWHLLNEARSALIEADACKIFYEECEHNPVEAVYRCRFYLDDAVLRLYSSCEHLLKCVKLYWGLRLPGKSRDSLLVKVITAAEKSDQPQLSGDVTTSLRGLGTDWAECKKYRDAWVHDVRPGMEGLDWEVSFKPWNAHDMPPAIVQALKDSGYPVPVTGSGKSVSVGRGRKIDELHRIVRNAYCQLFGVYERLAPLLN